jgi:hypothetical protein
MGKEHQGPRGIGWDTQKWESNESMYTMCCKEVFTPSRQSSRRELLDVIG